MIEESSEGRDSIPSSQLLKYKDKPSKLKASHFRSMLPPISMPPPKRSVQNSESKGAKENKGSDKKKHVGLSNILMQTLEIDKKQLEKEVRDTKFHVGNIIPKSTLSKNDLKQFQKVSQILAYLYNEFEKPQVPDSPQTKYKVYQDWQLMQIQENYRDTNLGDFIIKLPNPDFFNDEDQKQQDEQQKAKKNRVTFSQALQRYDSLFNTEKVVDKNLEQCQKVAFKIAFYLMGFQKVELRYISEKAQIIQRQFLPYYFYLLKIQKMTYPQYIEHKKMPQFRSQQLDLDRSRIIHSHIDRSFMTAVYQTIQEQQKQFIRYKNQIYRELRKMAIKKYASRSRDNDISDQKYKQRYNMSHHEFLVGIMKVVPSISTFLKNFPEIYKIFLSDIKQQMQKPNFSCQLALGGYLNRVSHQGEMKWILNSQRPSDLLTLLRHFLVYKLSQRGGLFIRSFLSQDQHFIFLVIKASEKHLQKMAQQSNFNMQLELGAVDIFSFEPVDKYGRPLRCNRYLRDQNFIKKYNLGTDKNDKDEFSAQVSVQSQALNIYKKAIQMNQQELRAKVVLDQQHCDSLLAWLAQKLGIRLIQPDQILNNQYNQDEVSEDIWPAYFIYNKMIIEYVSRLKQEVTFEQKNKKFKRVQTSIGLFARLMFLKALHVTNRLYVKHRDAYCKSLKNLFIGSYPLQNIWHQLGENVPRGYFPYFYSQKLQRIWRRYQINQQKDRSKFTPSDRLIITNQIIKGYLSLTKALNQKIIQSYYPIHDPFILKNIKIRPYLNVIKNLISAKGIQGQKALMSDDAFVQYQCDYTTEDFTKQSIQEKLKFKIKDMTSFSVNSIAFYCGEKLAFFFQFRRYLTNKSWPICLLAFIFQILFWVQNSQLQATGVSTMTTVNDVISIIMAVINILWVHNCVRSWQQREESLARSFGTNVMSDESQKNKRVMFEGQMRRNLETDQINQQYENKTLGLCKTIISFGINFLFVLLMACTILLIFALKNQMYLLGLEQSTVSTVSSTLITISIKVFNFIYGFMIQSLVQFQNKKTIHQYENSLISKRFIVTFIVTFFSLFIYAFFENYFGTTSSVCIIKTKLGTEVNNCYYYISDQAVNTAVIDLATTIAMAFLPFILFKVGQYFNNKNGESITFNLNYFQSIDKFYEEQDKMSSFMDTDQIDKTWEGYNGVVISFAFLALFAPIVPFLYFMMFVTGVVSMNAKKYEIIYFSKRVLPVKVKSIGVWLYIVKVIAVLGVFVNVGLVVYIREVISTEKSVAFFASVFIILVIKFLLSLKSREQDNVGKRCKAKIEELFSEKSYFKLNIKNDNINTDIENVYYDQKHLKRELPSLRGVNVKN